MELLAGKKTYVIGAALVALGALVLLGLSVKALPAVLMILGGLGLIALRLGARKAEIAALEAKDRAERAGAASASIGKADGRRSEG